MAEIEEGRLNDINTSPLDPTPKSFDEAWKDPEWQQSILSEWNSLQEDQTWKLEERPHGTNTNVIKCKWVFKVKSNGRKKSRLVACGYSQKYGIDYEETFSAVLHKSSFRYLLSLSTRLGLQIFHLDVSTAFLNASLEDGVDIYMQQPKGFDDGSGRVCKLLRVAASNESALLTSITLNFHW